MIFIHRITPASYDKKIYEVFKQFDKEGNDLKLSFCFSGSHSSSRMRSTFKCKNTLLEMQNVNINYESYLFLNMVIIIARILETLKQL